MHWPHCYFQNTVCYLNCSFSTFKNKQTPSPPNKSPHKTTTKHKDKKPTLCQQFVCLFVFFSYCRYLLYRLVPKVQNDMNTFVSTTLTPTTCYGRVWNTATQHFIAAFSSGMKYRAGLHDCQHMQKASYFSSYLYSHFIFLLKV